MLFIFAKHIGCVCLRKLSDSMLKGMQMLITFISQIKWRFWLRFTPYALCVILNFWSSSLTWSEVREKMPIMRRIPQREGFKVRHILQYGSQAALLMALIESSTVMVAPQSAMVALAVVSLDGAFEELHQLVVPTRIFAVMDILFDVLGAFVGICLFMGVRSVYVISRRILAWS